MESEEPPPPPMGMHDPHAAHVPEHPLPPDTIVRPVFSQLWGFLEQNGWTIVFVAVLCVVVYFKVILVLLERHREKKKQEAIKNVDPERQQHYDLQRRMAWLRHQSQYEQMAAEKEAKEREKEKKKAQKDLKKFGMEASLLNRLGSSEEEGKQPFRFDFEQGGNDSDEESCGRPAFNPLMGSELGSFRPARRQVRGG
eukprot:GILI01014467.1.p1 GENE.GILI01014467.1~~GILI01014467.1.p1  ORF type:complete len:213 (-),score=54.28 GILI01014467.1:780-1370(-)